MSTTLSVLQPTTVSSVALNVVDRLPDNYQGLYITILELYEENKSDCRPAV